MALNFAQQRKAAAKRSATLQHEDKLPGQRGYSFVGTDYQGEAGSQTLDIIDSGSKGTVVNKPNQAFSRLDPIDPSDAAFRALKYKKAGH